MIYIYHHLGLGDHIICNGLVRSLIKPELNYTMFVKKHNLNSVSFMYDDLKNLNFVVSDDNEIVNFLKNIPLENKIIIGFNSLMGFSWDQFFYYQHNIDFNKRWSNFKVNRNEKNEKNLYNFLNPNDEDFILIHSKGSDNIDRINYDVIDGSYKKIFVDKHTDNIFDYLFLIEKAKEIHCIESSFHVLVDSVKLNDNLFFHTLKNNRGFEHKIRDKWRIV